MCFHYSLPVDASVLQSMFNQPMVEQNAWRPSYHLHGFRFPSAPVITLHGIQLMSWGLIPSWFTAVSRIEQFRSFTLNARVETVMEKPSFRDAVQRFRCVVPASGFFEWMVFKGKKYPHYISSRSGSLFCFAGIYSFWRSPESAETVKTFSLLTTTANPLMRKIHNSKQRMPLILSDDKRSAWLTGEEQLGRFTEPISDEDMQAHPVSGHFIQLADSSGSPCTILPYTYADLNQSITPRLFD